MPVAPTPPTKPSPPVAPTVTLPSSNKATNPPLAASDNLTPNPGKSVSPAVSSTVKELEGLGKAFQGNSAQTKAGERSETAATTVNRTGNVAAPGMPVDSQAGMSAQTAVPTKPPAMDSKPAGISYLPFLGIVGAAAVILLGLRLFKNRARKNCTVIDHSKKANAVVDKEGLDIAAGPLDASPKVKSNFEVRI